MKKLSLFMSVVLVLGGLVGLFAMPASAADYAEDTIALVNDVEVTADNIQEYLDGCANGGTLKFVKDCEIQPIIISGNKWTVDGNGKTINAIAALNSSVYVIIFENCRATVKNLTIKTLSSGISISDGANVTLEDVNVYSGGTKEGLSAADAIKITEENIDKCSYAVMVNGTTRGNVIIDGGIYKAFGVHGIVLGVRQGNAVVYDGTFVGEDCSFVSRIYHNTKVNDMSSAYSSLTVYDGLFIKPVATKVAKNGTTNSDGAVIRPDAGAIFNCWGGTYINKAETGNDYVILGGVSGMKGSGETATHTTDKGFINIFGGKFYLTSTNASQQGELIGNYIARMEYKDTDQNITALKFTGAEAKQLLIDQCVANIYGGEFYTMKPDSDNVNITTIAAYASDGTTKSLQHLPKEDFKVVANGLTNQSAIFNDNGANYGDISGATLYSFAYAYNESNAKSGAKITVKNVTSTYYTDDLYTAINVLAQDGAEIILNSDLSAVKPCLVLNREHELTIDGKGHQVTFAGSGFTFYTGDITVKNLKLAIDSGDNAITIGKVNDDGTTTNSFALNLTVKDSTIESFRGSSDNLIKDLGVFEGEIKFESFTRIVAEQPVNVGTSKTYTAPTPTPPVLEEEEEDEEETTAAPDETTAATEAPAATDTEPAEEEGGCGSAVGIGTVALLAVSGITCAFASRRRRED